MFIIISSASNKYNKHIHPTAPTKPNTSCSSPGCNNQCTDDDGKRAVGDDDHNKHHTPRCCAVCGVWYCGSCKKSKMTKSKHQYNSRNGDGAPMPYMSDYGTLVESEIVWKCRGTCKGHHRQYHQS